MEDPDGFAAIYKPGGDTLTLIAGQMVDGEPYMSGRGFKYVAKDSTIAITRLNCPGDCVDGLVDVFLAGRSDVARQTWIYDRRTARDLVTESRKLVEVEIKAAPEDVGPPITILKVDKNGASWISNDVGCPTVLAPGV